MASVDTVNASSSSSSSSSLPFNNVFLSFRGSDTRKKFTDHLFAAMVQKPSFRGSDTRKKFTDHLFAAMVQKPIFTFRDDEALERGDAVDDADEMVQDFAAFLLRIGPENESLYNFSNEQVQLITNFFKSRYNLSNRMPEDGSTNWDLPPRFDDSPDEADDDADEMVQDYVVDLPLEAHVEPDDVADAPQEAHVERDDVADAPQEAHVVPYDVADAPQACPICVTNARNMAFHCGHTICVECGERLDTCHICRQPISGRIRLFLA